MFFLFDFVIQSSSLKLPESAEVEVFIEPRVKYVAFIAIKYILVILNFDYLFVGKYWWS